MPMNVYCVVIYLVIVLSGNTPVSIVDSFAPSEIATRLNISKSKAIFTQVEIVFNKFLKLFGRDKNVANENMRQVLNNMALTSTLLVTLTFAAAFTIPGGYDQTSGQALRMKETPVKVFLSFDIIAMILGMGVMFNNYTIWITQNRITLVRLVVRSAFMLQLSLFATMVAFIAGIYALASHDAIGIFIAAIVFAALFCVCFVLNNWNFTLVYLLVALPVP